ncbi:hypothetical protein BC832DRAFT_384580 [Gaertneriomyces semiglobifer]|nr:hypothetical protein BC832DRAFT_384580 [Gaertneriomyces semiglobifer]
MVFSHKEDGKRSKHKSYPSLSHKVDLAHQVPLAGVHLIPNLLTETECQSLVKVLPTLHPLELTAHARTRAVAFRDNDRVLFHSPELSSLVWSAGLGDLIERLDDLRTVDGLTVKGLNDQWRLYRYKEGQRFGPHFDEEAKGIDDQEGLVGRFTLLIYLNGGQESTRTAPAAQNPTALLGGETVFYTAHKTPRPVLSVSPQIGLALLHAQGRRCALHEGATVKKGGKVVVAVGSHVQHIET